MSSDYRHDRNVWKIEDQLNSSNSNTTYDKAMTQTGFGLFNILLLVAALPIAWTCIIDTTSTAFIINSSECIFELTTFRKGIAVSSIYLGMIIADPIWNFVLKDSIIAYMGKRNLMIIGMLLDALCNILWVHATSFTVFVLLKIISGLLIAGPLSVVMHYLAEFHAPTHQLRFSRWANLLVVVSNIIPAALAATIFLRTYQFHFTIYNRHYSTWRVYLLICAIPSVLGLTTACIMPNSPKYLLTQGKRIEAIRLIRIMFCLNRFTSSSKCQINELSFHQVTRQTINPSFKGKFQDSIIKFKMLFSAPFLKNILIIFLLQFSSMTGFHVMRLWVPSIFVVLNNFRVFLQSYYPPNEKITMCEMIFPHIQKINYGSCNYTLASVESAVYVNSTIITTSAVTFSFLFGSIILTRVKKIIMMCFMFLLSAIGSFAANWAVQIPYMLILLGFIIVACRIVSNMISVYSMEVMPKYLRVTAGDAINLIGNFAAAVGNIIFSLILGCDCLSAFLSIGCLLIVCSTISLVLIKQPNNKIETQAERC